MASEHVITIVSDPSNPSAEDVTKAYLKAPDLSDRGVPFQTNHGEVRVKITGVRYNGMTLVPGDYLITGRVDGQPVEGYYDANTKNGHFHRSVMER